MEFHQMTKNLKSKIPAKIG